MNAKIKLVSVTSLSEDPTNARIHPQRNIDALVASLRRFGQQKPIVVDKNNVVRAGNGLLQAAKVLGWETIGVIQTELEGVEATGFAIADNRASELSEWDFEILGKQFKALDLDGFNFIDIGWLRHEVEPLLQADWSPPAPGEMPTHNQEHHNQLHIAVTAEQKEVIDRAVDALRQQEGDDTISPGRALELIAADYLAGIHDAQPAAGV